MSKELIPTSTADLPADRQAEAVDFLLANYEMILDNIDASPLTRQKYKKDARLFQLSC